MPWHAYEDGGSVGLRGSEGGVIVRDEEHTEGARITLEEGVDIAPYAITCGVYGWMCHTRFFGSLEEADAESAMMKDGLIAILNLIPYEDDPLFKDRMRRTVDEVSAFVERFP